MNVELQKDLMCILLEECYGYREGYARRVANGEVPRESVAYDEVDHALNRIAARCSKIEG